MTWAATVIAVGAGVGSQIMGSKHAKKMAARQAALGREQAAKLRARAHETSLESRAEIDTLRTLRSMDVPAFKQASEQAVIQAQKGSERMQRQRMMGRLAPDVRDAIFGGQFQQYVGREMQRLGKHAALTQQILAATERQQQVALGVEGQAAQIEYSGESAALQTQMETGNLYGNILSAVGQAAGQFGSAQAAKSGAASASQDALRKDVMMQQGAGNFDFSKVDPELLKQLGIGSTSGPR